MNFGTWIGLVALVISLYILWQIRQVLLVLFTAVVLANALNILVKRFQRWGMKRGYAVLLSVSLSLTALVGFFWLIVPPFADQFQQLAVKVPEGIERLIDWLNLLKDRLSPDQIESLPDINELTKQLQPLVNKLLGGGLSFFYGSLGVLLTLLLLLVLTLMLLADPQPYRRGFVRLFPSFYRRRVDEILVLCEEDLQGWLTGIFLNMGVIAVLSFIGLLILGIPLALAQAMLAGILTFIPNIGPALSVVSPMAIALLEEPWKALAVLILYIVIQQVESHVLTPLVIGQQVSLLSAVTLLAQVFFATFFGFLGLFLALPLTVVGTVWLREVLIKDILDQWRTEQDKEALPAAATKDFQPIPPETETTSVTEGTKGIEGDW
ncbi:MAG: AI-2E family transporter [Xenococcaceae cyanobacterium]